jgi:hypothetical protein
VVVPLILGHHHHHQQQQQQQQHGSISSDLIQAPGKWGLRTSVT